MELMKTSLCLTLLNEEKSIAALLTSIYQQTKLPDEIIIVDGGSKDNTLSIIKSYSKQIPKIKLIIEKNASRSKGRNIGVEKSKNQIITMTDADCILNKNWLANITKPFKDKKVDLVAGFYNMKTEGSFQKSLAPFLGITPKKFSNDFLPSTRSVAFKKSLWKKVGGFYQKNNENTGEDTIFNYEAVRRGANIKRAKNAIVYWQLPESLEDALKKFFNYAKWDAKYGIWWHPVQKFKTHNLKVLTIFARYILFLIFWPLFFVYLIYAYWKAGPWGTIIQVSSDFAIMAGFIYGIF